jgi:hypothetical protein
MNKHIDIGAFHGSHLATKEERKMAYTRKLFAVLTELAALDGDTEEAKAFREISMNARHIKYRLDIEVVSDEDAK